MKAEKNILSNGIRVISVKDNSIESVFISVLVKTGSRNEGEKVKGLSHFLEHMTFKGTPSRPTPDAIASEMDKIGAQNNAFTEKETTGFWLKSRTKHFEQISDILFDMVFNSKLEQTELDKERDVIFEEIKMYEDAPMYWVMDLFTRLVYKGTTMADDILGYRETLKNITRQDFIDYRNKYYGTDNIVISLAGNIPDNYLDLFETKLKNTTVLQEQEWEERGELEKGLRTLVEYRDTGQGNMVLGFNAPGYLDKDYYTLYLLNTILGSGMSSPLFSEVREKRGLAYAVSSEISANKDGYLMIYAGVNGDKMEEALKVILEIIKDIEKYLTEENLLKAKEQVSSRFIYRLENSMERAMIAGKRELYRLGLFSPEETIKKIETITLEEVNEMAKKVFILENAALAIIGPYKDKDKFEKLLK